MCNAHSSSSKHIHFSGFDISLWLAVLNISYLHQDTKYARCTTCFISFCRRERKKYHTHREKARSNPNKLLTLIIDGMDQAKTNLPFTKLIAKSTSSLWRLCTHVSGVLDHTKAPFGKLAYSFIDLLQCPHDSNMTISLIIHVLSKYTSSGRNLPDVLYIQMDNTSRENKNKYVIGFCVILVQLKVFKKVTNICA